MRFDNITEGVAKIACTKCDEVSTAKAWEKNNGFCPKCKTSSQGVAESEDTRMGTITVTSDEERKRRAKAYRDKKLKSESKQNLDQIDEISKNKVDAYLDASHNDFKKQQGSGKPMTPKQKKRHATDSKAYNMAYNKLTGRGKVNATEEVDEKTNLDDYYMDVAKAFKKENPKLELSGLGWTKKGMIAVKDMNGDEWEYNPRTRKLTLMTEATINIGDVEKNKRISDSVTEVSTEKLRDYASAALQDKNKDKATKRWKYAGKATQTVADREAQAAHDRKHNTVIDEARRSSYEVFRSAQAKERNKKYRAPTQDEIDADRKKDEKGKPRPSISTKSINKKMYEALTLDYSRYMRSHGKKPRPGSGVWMFTTTDMGEPAEDDVFQFSGNLADAKRAAAKWAKGKGAYRFYVMEKTVTEDDCQCANGETTQEQLLDMLENAMISIEQDLESGKLMDAHALQLGENYLVYEALYNKIKGGADLGESANQKLDEVDWGTVGNIAMTAAPLLIPGVGVGALAGLAGRAALGALAKRGGTALIKRGLEKIAPNLMKRLGQTKVGRALGQIGGQAAVGVLNPAADGPDVDRPDSGAGQDLLGLAAKSGLSSTDLELVKKAVAARK